jgi:hypothetical protein
MTLRKIHPHNTTQHPSPPSQLTYIMYQCVALLYLVDCCDSTDMPLLIKSLLRVGLLNKSMSIWIPNCQLNTFALTRQHQTPTLLFHLRCSLIHLSATSPASCTIVPGPIVSKPLKPGLIPKSPTPFYDILTDQSSFGFVFQAMACACGHGEIRWYPSTEFADNQSRLRHYFVLQNIWIPNRRGLFIGTIRYGHDFSRVYTLHSIHVPFVIICSFFAKFLMRLHQPN